MKIIKKNISRRGALSSILRNFSLGFMLFIPIWITLTYAARVFLGKLFFQISLINFLLILITLLCIYSCIKLSKNFFTPLRNGFVINKLQKFVLIVVGLFVCYNLCITVYNHYIICYDSASSYRGVVNSDFAFHLSLSHYLQLYPTLNGKNPFYYGGGFLDYYFFDLLITMMASLFHVSLFTSFYLLSPALIIMLALSLWLLCCLNSRSWIEFVFFTGALYVISTLGLEQAPYNALGMLYSIFYVFIVAYIHALIEIGNQSLDSKRVSFFLLVVFFLLSYFIVNIKIMFWPQVLGVVLTILIFSFIRACISKNGRALTISMRLFCYMLLPCLLGGLLFLVPASINSTHHPYTFALPLFSNFHLTLGHLSFIVTYPKELFGELAMEPNFRLFAIQNSFLLYLLVVLVLFCKRKRMGFSLGVQLCSIGSIIVSYSMMFLLTPRLYDGGASNYYPNLSIATSLVFSLVFLLRSIYFSNVRNILIRRTYQSIFYGVFSFVFVSSVMAIPYLDNTHFLKKVNHANVMTVPDVGTIDLIKQLNKIGNPSESVITNYFWLDRCYSFSIFSNLVPFMSSPAYGGIDKNSDYASRMSLLNLFFNNNQPRYFFRELTERYPMVKYILIDNAPLYLERMPAEAGLPIFTNIIYTSVAPKFFPNDIIRDKQGNKKIFIKKYPSGQSIKVISFHASLNAALKMKLIKLIRKTKTSALYRIQ